MSISMRLLKSILRINPAGILHVGAHTGEEHSQYKKLGWLKTEKVIWVEAIEELSIKLLESIPEAERYVLNILAWDTDDDEIKFNLTSNLASSSALTFGSHEIDYPEIFVEKQVMLRTSRLDSVLTAEMRFNFMVLDVQGTELQVLRGLGHQLKNVKWIVSECHSQDVYKGGSHVFDLDLFLKSHGFKRRITEWNSIGGWGDALYLKEDGMTRMQRIKIKVEIGIYKFLKPALYFYSVYLQIRANYHFLANLRSNLHRIYLSLRS